MIRVGAWLFALVAGLVGLTVVYDFLLGPWEPVDLSYRAPEIPQIEALDAWLAAREAEVPNLRQSAAKSVVWAGAPGEKTPLSVVYVHGFSAAAPELRPVPDQFASALGANLHFTRLSGHGRDGAAMAEPMVRDWADDLAEALAIGRAIGDRVIVMGASMGGALATQAALDPAYGADVAGLALFAPAYRLPPPGGRVITLPFARYWGPLLIGKTRVVEPRSPAHGEAWTLTYPTVSVLPLGALVRVMGAADTSAASLPAIFFLSDEDQVVDPAAIRAVAGRWGGPHELVPLVMGAGDDSGGHVIAGDILSPGQNALVLKRLLTWAEGLR